MQRPSLKSLRAHSRGRPKKTGGMVRIGRGCGDVELTLWTADDELTAMKEDVGVE